MLTLHCFYSDGMFVYVTAVALWTRVSRPGGGTRPTGESESTHIVYSYSIVTPSCQHFFLVYEQYLELVSVAVKNRFLRELFVIITVDFQKVFILRPKYTFREN